MNIASRILVTKQDNINGRRGGEKGKSQGGFPELFSACPGGKHRRRRRWRRRRGSNLVGEARRDTAFYLAKVLWVSLLPTLFADRTLLAAAYALHVSELCTLWIFNEPYAIFFPDRYRETARKNNRTLRSELIYETGRT